MNILLDTNILIPLEDTGRILDVNMADIKRLSSSLKYQLFYHEKQIEDIGRDNDESRKKIVLSRLIQYNRLPAPPIPKIQDIESLGWKESSENDKIDNILLFALFRNACHILVTNDNNIHTKAKNASLGDRVYRSEQFLNLLNTCDSNRHAKQLPYGIVKKYLHEFCASDQFFLSIHKAYNKFDEWYNKSAREQREAWCLIDANGKLHGICIYKEEKNPLITDSGSPIDGKVLKLCTFKIGENLRGKKFGERMLYTALKFAHEQDYDWIYLHTYGSEHAKLTGLFTDFGFKLYGKYKGDDVYLKSMKPRDDTKQFSPLKYAIDFYPHFRDDLNVNKFIIPIRRSYHDQIFPDKCEDSLFRDDPTFYTSQSNTIKKAYICNSSTKLIKSGDIVIFYRSGSNKALTCLGIVESANREKDINRVLSLVSKRTVYSSGELAHMIKEKEYVLVILFRLIKYFKNDIPYKDLLNMKIHGAIQSIRKIEDESYTNIMGVAF